MTNLKTPAKEVGFTHEDFAALLDKYDYHFSPGDIVAGTVFSIEPRGALIDIGAKTAAYIPIQEMSINRVENPEEVIQSNETREFFILTDENEDGQLTLSIRRIEYMRAWERVRQLQAEDATVRSQVFATNRGGALVRIEGLRGFIPGSHISTRKPKEDLLNEELPLKFLEVDEERNRLVLSHRRALVERKMNRLEVGEVVIGAVRGIKPYGAFIDIGGVSGLLHISEISHDHIETPSSVLKVNDELKVMIIDLDSDRGRISLSTKQLEPEPGAMVKNPQLVYDQAEEMAAKFREKMLAAQRGETIEETVEATVETTEAPEVEAAVETTEAPEVEAAEAPEVEATVETTEAPEAPEVEATGETTEAPEVEATGETTEAPEVEATGETTEAPEVEATGETTEAPEVEATGETTEAPEVEATAETTEDEEKSAATVE
ncbi:MAG: S1 RNA-binding domain-containing protein [Okeania sp. SIO2G4]|uniref:30S ribosomal protein S1 n=1 Tax=unclassified Okeania TaxID=2634635 RepID=UPI0013B67CCE|nr:MULTISPECIES: S1 RNA-binding domain-containing protein [unclassified Okeania]NEP95547.1 S1 RNA-binding domain-containing protein [Okeania sp. SIO2F5]NEQ93260.1 S1 RNA-binding domain-containing protein [Okeania sp. SIO2G4]